MRTGGAYPALVEGNFEIHHGPQVASMPPVKPTEFVNTGECEVVFKVCTYNANSLDAPAGGKGAPSAKAKGGRNKTGAPRGIKGDMLAIQYVAKGIRIISILETKSRKKKKSRRAAYV